MAVNGDICIRTVCLLTAFGYITRQGAVLGEVTLGANSVLDQFGMVAAFLLDGFANVSSPTQAAPITMLISRDLSVTSVKSFQ